MAQLPILSQSESSGSHPGAVGVPPAHLQVRETQRAAWGLFTHPRANGTVSIAPKAFGSRLQNRCQYFDKNTAEGAASERGQAVPRAGARRRALRGGPVPPSGPGAHRSARSAARAAPLQPALLCRRQLHSRGHGL